MFVNLCCDGDKGVGNKIGIILVDFFLFIDDVYVWLCNVGYLLCNVWVMIDVVVFEVVEIYIIFIGLFGQIVGMFKLVDVVMLLGNMLVFNVFGLVDKFYFKGVELCEMYLLLMMLVIYLMNIILFSYVGMFYFGLIVIDVLFNLGWFVVYVEEEIVVLELVVGI